MVENTDLGKGNEMKRRFVVNQPMHYYGKCIELCRNNHILIGGRTGSGKSVLLNDFLYSMMAFTPVENKFYLIDPKRVELSWYKNTSHCIGYADSVSSAIDILCRAINTMETRYKEMERRHIRAYDGAYIYVVIDELADLMLSAKKLVMPLIQKIGQLGRAARVFLICATQAPSRKVIPAEITLNLGCKIALSCESGIESRQVIGMNGAEMLPRYGECIIKTADCVQKVKVNLTSDTILNERISYWERNKGKIAIFGKCTPVL